MVGILILGAADGAYWHDTRNASVQAFSHSQRVSPDTPFTIGFVARLAMTQCLGFGLHAKSIRAADSKDAGWLWVPSNKVICLSPRYLEQEYSFCIMREEVLPNEVLIPCVRHGINQLNYPFETTPLLHSGQLEII
jgi:hypothetical protein